MMIKKEKGVKPILLNIGLAFGFSFAGFLCSRLRTNQGHEVNLGRDVDATCSDGLSSENSSNALTNSSKQNGDRDEFLLPEFDELVKEVEFEVEARKLEVKSSIAYEGLDKDEYEQEIHRLKNMVRLLQDKEQNLEVQLLEYYGLKEQETVVMEFENRLKITNMQVEMFNLKAKSLQSENRKLREQVADHANVLAELDAAKAKIELLNKEIRREAEQNKERIVSLQQRVAMLQDQDCKDAACDQDIKSKLQKLEAFESEVEELRESNSRSQIENSDLTRRFDSTQILANDANQESERLRKENEDLLKQIEQIQSDRRSDIEELLYVRWVNARLRQELQNHQPLHNKTVANDLSKSLKPTPLIEAKKLILECADTNGLGINVDIDLNHRSSSQSSSITDSGEYDHFSSGTNAKSQNKFFGKLKRLILGKDRHHRHIQVSSGYQENGNAQRRSTSTDTDGRTSFDRRYSSFDGEGSFSDFLGLEKSDLEKYAEALEDSTANDKHKKRGRSTSFS
ncbi:protein CHUP1, chloroplastic-like [Vicia villosa]|uniref:protein CHUP1, chloroplastic-like n=1 Tax=Vicia villosa TaxID=3911 RepID=UPI00273AB18F|nr:protein CHUP1, chloroplastic-like [Vicia villosa]